MPLVKPVVRCSKYVCALGIHAAIVNDGTITDVDEVILNILAALRSHDVDDKELDKIVRAGSKKAHDGRKRIAKKHILPHYLRVKAENGETWRSWDVDASLDERFVKTVQMKPRRSASGVATITVITKPWPCANNCVYCPNDPTMPKSYLSDEPACQRAERNQFEPYLQVASRLRTLQQMGHATDKVELIVLGGTWLDYPEEYRVWFIAELFRALNDSDEARANALSEEDPHSPHPGNVGIEQLEALHRENERAAHRVVGLVVETRPDTITLATLRSLRALGCTKIQLGVQSIDDSILQANGRSETSDKIASAFDLCRLFGFKIHAHFMVNLLGATPESDKHDYRVFANDGAYSPDEVKLYPCALVAGTALVDEYERGSWKPYTEEELVDVLTTNLVDTPPFTRISRMIRDISSQDILVGNKKTNLRQLVEQHVAHIGALVKEIRYREVGTGDIDFDSIALDELTYQTRSTDEVFIQWVTESGNILGFLRLSLPKADAIAALGDTLPIAPAHAMIREVHVYGFATQIDKSGTSAQHRGLGRALVERACEIARDKGYVGINVISAIGTREYYRKLGFEDAGLYQRRIL